MNKKIDFQMFKAQSVFAMKKELERLQTLLVKHGINPNGDNANTEPANATSVTTEAKKQTVKVNGKTYTYRKTI
jgi:hypothetical protein